MRRDGRIAVEATGAERIDVEWPSRSLRDLVLIDSPARASVERVYRDADAVLYLTRHMHSADLEQLRSAHDHPFARATPVDTVVVLARADEIGAGRIDALSSARQVARRYRREASVIPLCQNVVAVSGLLAVASRTLRDDEFTALSTLARHSRVDLEDHLLSVDRFVSTDLPLDRSVRHALVERFGIFGVRLTTTLVRQGCDTPVKLSAQLAQRSGLGELRESIGLYFAERRDVLKARAALLGLDVVLRATPRPAAARLTAAMERLVASAHDFRELRLLAALHAGRVRFSDELDDEAVRLIGGTGTSMLARLAIEYEPTDGELRHAVLDAVARWREHAANPVLDNAQRRAAAVVVRSCEGMYAGLG